ncbi:MAG: glycosyltransferase family 9 protein [Magnetococcales bacterium]|nr:glycosyltransferase family 9 protein [Magnetococcales bacterium]
MNDLSTLQRLLVIYNARIGDVMLSTPAIRALKKEWPQARLDFIGSVNNYMIMRHLPQVHRTRGTKKKWMAFQGWWPSWRYDLALVYGFDKDGPFVSYATRMADRVVAFRQADSRLNDKLYRAVEKVPPGSCHAVDQHLGLIHDLGLAIDGRHLSYCISEEEQRWARTYLNTHGIDGHSPLIGLQVASFPTKAFRDWPIENFLALSNALVSHHPGAYFLILGGPLEMERTSWLAHRLGTRATSVAGQLRLRQSAALMGCLDLYIGVDTGPTHIMGALGRPMVAMYHSSGPSWILAPLEHPCCFAIDHPHAGRAGTEASMGDITVETVLLSSLQALTRPTAKQGASPAE